MLKIAIVSDVVYPYSKGGTEKRIYEISTRLARKGNQVTVYCMQWWEGSAIRIEDGVQLKAISPCFPLYAGEKRSIKEALFFALHCFKLLREDFDILDVNHMPHLVLFSTKIVALLKRKKLHALWNEVWGLSYWMKYIGVSGLIAALIERVTALLPDRFIAVSDHTARALAAELSVPPRKITVVPNGISIKALANVAPSASRSDVIFVGRLLSHKNVDVLIQSIASLKERYPDIKCVIVGRGPEQAALHALIQRHALGENVEMIECIDDHEQLYALMKASRVFAFPSTREGFGIVVLEANACGLPVITTDHAQNAARELIWEGLNGKVIPLSPEQLSAAIAAYMMTQPDPTRYMSILQPYDWDNLTQKMENLYTVQSSPVFLAKESLEHV